MTSRENFHQMMQRDHPQWLPLHMPMTAPVQDMLERQYGTRDPVIAFNLDFTSFSIPIPGDSEAWRAAFARIGFALPANVSIGFAGITQARPPSETIGQAYHFRQMLHPLSVIRSADQLSTLPWPDISHPPDHTQAAQNVRAIHDAGRVAVGDLEMTLFESAWYLRGMDNLLLDLIEENGIGGFLLDWFTNRSVQVASAYCRAGADVIALGDDVGTQRGMMMSVDFWRRHFKPRLQKVIDAVRANQQEHVYIRYHCDGDLRPIIPDLIDMGVDILNPVQPECMPAEELIAQFKACLAFWGLVGTQTTMPFGTPREIQELVRRCAGWVEQGAAIVVSPTHVLEPEVPWENIHALVRAVRATRL